MIERRGYHVCKECGEEIAWTVFIRKEYVEQEKMMKAKCPGMKIVRFTRYKMGEGLEKRSDDLAAEVAAQMQMK